MSYHPATSRPAGDSPATTSPTTSPTTSDTTRRPTGESPAGPPDRQRETASHASPAVTHRIVTPRSVSLVDLAEADETREEGGPVWRDRVSEALSGLRFYAESPGSLRDQIEYAIDGAYSINQNGFRRKCEKGFAYFVAVPGLTLCLFLAWALFTRLTRALTAWPVLILTFWALMQIPLVNGLAHFALDVVSWVIGPTSDVGE